MQVELSLDELNEVLQALDEHSDDYELIDRLAGILREAEELESIDLNDCGDTIPPERRKAAPWATRCVYFQEVSEVGRR